MHWSRYQEETVQKRLKKAVFRRYRIAELHKHNDLADSLSERCLKFPSFYKENVQMTMESEKPARQFLIVHFPLLTYWKTYFNHRSARIHNMRRLGKVIKKSYDIQLHCSSQNMQEQRRVMKGETGRQVENLCCHLCAQLCLDRVLGNLHVTITKASNIRLQCRSWPWVEATLIFFYFFIILWTICIILLSFFDSKFCFSHASISLWFTYFLVDSSDDLKAVIIIFHSFLREDPNFRQAVLLFSLRFLQRRLYNK